jgi:hypothetical protein
MLIPVKEDKSPKSTVGRVIKNTMDAVTGRDTKDALRRASGNPPDSYLKDAQSDVYNKTKGFDYKLPTK